MKHFTILIILAGLLYHASAQTLTAVTDTSKILIGQPFHLKLQANFKEGQTLSWLKLDSIPHFEIMQTDAVDTQHFEGRVLLTQVLTLTSWDSGLWQIPVFSMAKMKTKPIKVDVAFSPSPFDVNQPYHEIKELIDVRKPQESKWYWYLIFLAVLVALFLLFFPPGKKKEAAAFVADPGAYQTALKKLAALKPDMEPKLLYTELVQIFRDYLLKRKNIRSHSRTTNDLAIQLGDLDLPREDYQKMIQALRLSDLVKYARFQPTVEENKNAIRQISETITMIENTPHAV